MKQKRKPLTMEEKAMIFVAGAAGVAGLALGGYVGYEIGFSRGYVYAVKVCSDAFAGVAPKFVEELGHAGSTATIMAIKHEIPEAYKLIHEHSFAKTADKYYYDFSFIKKVLADCKSLELPKKPKRQ